MMYENDASMIMTRCQTAAVIKDDLYVVDGNTGYLNIIDLNNRRIKKAVYMDKIYGSTVKIAYVLKVGQSIWVVPLYAAVMIAEYDLETESVQFYRIGENSSYYFSYVVNLGTTLYLIPYNLSGMLLQFSTLTHKVVSDDRWLKKVDVNRDRTIFMTSELGSKIFCILVNDNRIISYDLLDGKFQEKNLDIDGGINGIAIFKDKICLILKKIKYVLLWDYKKDSIQKIELKKKEEFLNPLVVEDRILLSNGHTLFWFFDNQIEKIENIIGLKNDTIYAAHFYRGYIWKDKVILPPCHSNMFLEIDKSTYKASGFVISIPENDKKNYFLTNTLIKESMGISLVDYINTIII